jgi:hypothetical protein
MIPLSLYFGENPEYRQVKSTINVADVLWVGIMRSGINCQKDLSSALTPHAQVAQPGGELHFQIAQVTTGFTKFDTFDDLFQSQVFYQLNGGYPIAPMEIAQSGADL